MITVGHKDGSIEKLSAVRLTQVIKGFKAHTVIGGEFAIVSDNEHVAFKTLLGSCVAIMFYDQVLKIKGMNHFLLPSTKSSNEDMKYGLYSVEAMLNEMYKMGCKKGNMVAKIAGGADIVGVGGFSFGKSIGERNVEFAVDFCRVEGFKIISNHTRGTVGRIILLANNFETFIKTVQNSAQTSEVIRNENSLAREISNRRPAISEGVTTEIFDKNISKQDSNMEVELF